MTRHLTADLCNRIRTLALVLLLVTSLPIAAANGAPSYDSALKAALKAAIEDKNSSFNDRFEAEVWLMDMSSRLKPSMPNEVARLTFLKQLHFEATRARLAPELVLALIEVESHFDRFAISRSGAQGYMQIMPFWLNEIDHPNRNLHNAQTNLRMGCTILRYYLDIEADKLRPALARYNGSKGSRVYPEKVFKALRTRWYRQ